MIIKLEDFVREEDLNCNDVKSRKITLTLYILGNRHSKSRNYY